MPIVSWSDHFKTGIDIIDAQHKDLLDSLNELSDAARESQSGRIWSEKLASIALRSIKHFQTEEILMKEIGYPTRCDHLNQHCDLILQVRSIQYKQSKGQPLDADVAQFLVNWFEHHIVEADMDYVEFMKGMKPKGETGLRI